jgi:hypothetical protein
MWLVSASPFLFATLVAVACGTAALLGGTAGRWTALLYVTAYVSTTGASYVDWRWASPNYLVFAIDTVLLLGLYVVALRSRRYWPIWLAGLHVLTVCAHFSAMLAPALAFRVYFILEVVWSLPKMGVLLLGVLIDWRRDRDRRGGDGPRRDRSRRGHATGGRRGG